MKRAGWLAGLGLLLVVGQPIARWILAPAPPRPPEAVFARAARVTIVRDAWGVPHVFGPTDADAAFGLAYAHAEDDWPTIQGVLAASRGRLGWVAPSWMSLQNDGYVALIDLEGELTATWDRLEPHTRAVFDAYADGLSLYAWEHPEEADARLLPYDGRDVARGFLHKLPLMVGVGDVLAGLGDGDEAVPGSNAHGISRLRSADGKARLNVNSHQPWKGPVTWYEAHVHSDEGWDMYGGTFPGAPMILHGTAPDHGWALTVNTPDRVDVYALRTDPARPGQYLFDGTWRPFEEKRAWLPLDTPWLTVWIPRTFRRTVHGPVVEADGRSYAVRHVAMGQGALAAEQWFQMNRAPDFAAWLAAMDRLAIPMFNVVYANADHIYFLYNARIPVRADGFDYERPLPGDDPRALWTEFYPRALLPQVLDPAAGWVQACNSSPGLATIGPEAPSAALPHAGIEDRPTARAMRTHELLADGAPVDHVRFLALKWDRTLPRAAPLFTELIEPLRTGFVPATDDERLALDRLLQWDGRFDEASVGASIAVLAWRELDGMGHRPKEPFDPAGRLRFAARFLREHYGRIDVPLGELQRLVHGDTDLPLGGGPDVLNTTYVDVKEGRLIGKQGDSFVLVAEYDEAGSRAWSIHQYGASLRPESAHFSDQSPLFVRREMKPVLRSLAELKSAGVEDEYHPGARR